MCPDLPMPLTSTRPRRSRMRETAARKRSSTRSIRARTASASMASTRRARSSTALGTDFCAGFGAAFIIAVEYSPTGVAIFYADDGEFPAIRARSAREQRAGGRRVPEAEAAGHDRLRGDRARDRAARARPGVGPGRDAPPRRVRRGVSDVLDRPGVQPGEAAVDAPRGVRP